MNLHNSNQIFQVIDHEITFQNQEGLMLSGTLSVPQLTLSSSAPIQPTYTHTPPCVRPECFAQQKVSRDAQSFGGHVEDSDNYKPAVVILVSGYGKNDRDYTVMGRKLFLTISQYLSSHGIAVLRYDKRGVGKSQGTYDLTLTSADFAKDVLSAVQFLKNRTDIDTKKIGLVGSSEGGLISFMVASQSSDVAFVVSMAGAASNDVVTHFEMQLKADGATDQFLADDRKIREQMFQIIATQSPDDAQISLTALLKSYVDHLTDTQKIEAKNLPFAITEQNYLQMVATFNSAWYRFYLQTNALNFISKVTVPVLAINGDLDFCISAKLALPKIAQGLKMAHNPDVTILTILHANHWFQLCQTGAMREYGMIKENMHESTLKLITDWIISKSN